MSEYQYYEFQITDRPLTEEEQSEISALSRRVALTPTQAVFTYSFGDFRGDPKRVLEKYFDAMLYLANWGTKQLVFRLPRAIVDVEALAPYCFPDVISTSSTRDYVALDICFHEEEGGFWVEGEGWLSSLIPLRQDLLRGDFRLLYLAWLKAATLGEDFEDHLQTSEDHEDEGDGYEEDDDSEISRNQVEPPVPANLQNLSQSLKSFVKLFEIDDDLIAVASESGVPKSDATELDVGKWVTRLPEEERTDFLVRIARGEPHVDVLLMRRLHQFSLANQVAHEKSISRQRTIAELCRVAETRARLRKEQQRQAAEQARIRQLDALAPKEPELWKQVFALIEKKQPKAYDEAVTFLVQLRDLAKHLGQSDRFKDRVNQIREDYRNRPGLLSRLRHAGLVPGGV